jgi:hypothetical protein
MTNANGATYFSKMILLTTPLLAIPIVCDENNVFATIFLEKRPNT